MKIFKASLLLLTFFFSITACKTKQTAYEQQKKDSPAAVATQSAVQPAQVKKDTAYSVFSLDKARKTIYRGLKNPMTIVVPNAVWTKVEGNGVMKVDDFGHYRITPGLGTKMEIKVSAQMPDGSVFNETRILNIRNVPNPQGYFSIEPTLKTGYFFTEEEIKRAEVELMITDFDYDIDFKVIGFDVYFPNGKKIKVQGNKFDAKALEQLKKVKHNGKVTIQNIASELNPDYVVLWRPTPIEFKVNKKARPKKK